MQPIKISIQGDYIDCQIYRGRLYLWSLNGSLQIYMWDQIVESFITKATDRIAMTFSFIDGNYLYKSSIFELFADKDFKFLLNEKFKNITNKSFHLSEDNVRKYLIGEQSTPTNNIPTDTEIYGNNLYFITDKGFFSSTAHRDKNEKYLVSSKPKKLWDCNLLTIKANKYPQIALSGGSEGLYEFDLLERTKPNNLKAIETNAPIYQISERDSSFSNYSYLSIYNTSIANDSFMALFSWHKKDDDYRKNSFQREYDETINENKIFSARLNNKAHLSWGVEDKIYKATDDGFEIVKFNNHPKIDRGESYFTQLHQINLSKWKGKVTNGGTAYFGTIIECENALVVMLSNGQNITIQGPITRWRVYPRSMNYENHLHVILEDRIEIYSFNQDYFLNQEEKSFGIQYSSPKANRKYSSDIGNSFFDFVE